jgi:hypothetical protein
MSKRSNLGRNVISSVNFSYLTIMATVSTVQVSPNTSFSPRLAAVADTFEQYRIVKWRFRVRRPASTAGELIVAFNPSSPDSPPVNLANCSESPYHSYAAGSDTVPGPWVNVPRSVLMGGPLKWYRAVIGTFDNIEEFQGTISCGAITSGSLYVEHEGVCEFRAPIATASTPSLTREQRQLKLNSEERDRLFALLAVPKTGPAQ